jgi:hypothetical protein
MNRTITVIVSVALLAISAILGLLGDLAYSAGDLFGSAQTVGASLLVLSAVALYPVFLALVSLFYARTGRRELVALTATAIWIRPPQRRGLRPLIPGAGAVKLERKLQHAHLRIDDLTTESASARPLAPVDSARLSIA